MIFLEKPAGFSPKIEVVSCFIEVKGKILLLHRQNHRPQGNTWGVPAGKVEKGEELEGAIRRELLEEIGYSPLASSLSYFNKVFIKYPDFDFIYHMFRCALDAEPRIILAQEEHKDYAWKTPEQALKMNLIPDEDPCIRLLYKI